MRTSGCAFSCMSACSLVHVCVSIKCIRECVRVYSAVFTIEVPFMLHHAAAAATR